MDELEISGKRYISTRRAAREHGYHSDYMGQLIRGKKVAGQKVGRAWYIEEDSLNVYLGKAPSPTPTPTPAPVERLIVEEPAPVAAPVATPEPIVELSAPEPIAVRAVIHPAEAFAKEEGSLPIMVRVEPQAPEPVRAQAAVQEIHHSPIDIERQMGGLRYAPDDAPSMPVFVNTSAHFKGMPQAPVPAGYYAPDVPQAARAAGRFPYVSLSIVGIVAILVTAFASNFVSATIVSQEGKAATVQYAIHW